MQTPITEHSSFYGQQITIWTSDDGLRLAVLLHEDKEWLLLSQEPYGLVGNPFHLSAKEVGALYQAKKHLTEEDVKAYVESGTRPCFYPQDPL